MADVIRIELNVEEYEEVKKALVKRLAGINEASEEYRKLDAITGKIYRAQWIQGPQTTQTENQRADDGGQRTASQEVGDAQQAPAKPQQAQTSFKPALPPLETYQQQSQRTDGGGQRTAGAGHVISEKQAKRLYAIQCKIGKKQYEVKEYLKRMGFGSSKEVTSDKYDAIINWIQG